MRFTYLDGIRGMAALFVLAHHWNSFFSYPFVKSYLAVDLFFLLSGFVIAHAYDRKLRGGAITPGGFMRIRFARLYPLYLLSVVLSTALVVVRSLRAAQPESPLIDWFIGGALALLFVPFHVGGTNSVFAMNGAYWSLSQEMLVNLLYAYTRRVVNNTLLVVIVGLSAAAIVLIGLTTGTINHGYQPAFVSLAGGFARALFGIGLGMLLYSHRERFATWTRNVPAWLSFPLVAAVMMAPEAPWAFDLVGIFLILPLAVVIGSGHEPARAWQVRGLEALGIASYPLYLFHMPLGYVPTKVAALIPEWQGFAAAGIACVLFFICLQLDKSYDMPARQWLRERLQGRRVVAKPDPA